MNGHAEIRVAFFPDTYLEVNGVSNTSRHFAAFARERGLPMLVVHTGPRQSVTAEDCVRRVQLERSRLQLRLDHGHAFDLLFYAQYRRLLRIVGDFQPDVIQITGPSDIGMLGACVAHKLKIPLAATWQTNLHEYARHRFSHAATFAPQPVRDDLSAAAETLSFRAAARFYRIPKLLFAPNCEIAQKLQRATGKPCLLMSHSVDTQTFSPEFRDKFRDRNGGPFQIGFVGRLTTEKNVHALPLIEEALEKRLKNGGSADFEFIVVGQGAQEPWLRENLRRARFTGVLTGCELSRAFANLDALVVPSETETFGLVVLEALASGVPAVVSPGGGPKFIVEHGKTGFVAKDVNEFAEYLALLMTDGCTLARMRDAARRHALGTSWETIFEGVYAAYEKYLLA